MTAMGQSRTFHHVRIGGRGGGRDHLREARWWV